ncbi:hypothetical protein GEMRC1_002902 [Eukaryota sp. GEM-RC1]
MCHDERDNTIPSIESETHQTALNSSLQCSTSSFSATLYSDLLKLIETRYFMKNDVELDGVKYRIFNNRIYSLKNFELPNALNARGTMFEIPDEPLQPILRSLPMKKFLNLGELKTVPTGQMFASEKRDGSLISTYLHKG